jgi:hypothetical protein
MSVVGEASAIFGLITGSIDLLKLAFEISQAANGNAPKRIKKVAEQLPSIEQLLEDAQNTKGEHDEAELSRPFSTKLAPNKALARGAASGTQVP